MSGGNEVIKEPTVSISFKFHGKEILHQISINNPAVININEIASDAIDNNTSFGYGGKHDHGLLPQLKYDVANGNLISSLQEAKQSCDEYLTLCMKNEIDESKKDLPDSTHQTEKKPRCG
jgi:hypothetical protein